jgi:signal transduction histidine kinase
MSLHSPLWLIPWAGGALASLALVVYARRDWDRSVGVAFSVMAYAFALTYLTLVTFTLPISATPTFTGLLFVQLNLTFFLLPFVVAPFGFAYLGRDKLLEPKFIALLLAVPAALTLEVLYGALPVEVELFEQVFTVVLFIGAFLSYLLYAVLIFLVFWAGVTKEYIDLPGVTAISGALLLQLLLGIAAQLALTSKLLMPAALFPANAAGAVVTAGCFWLAVTRYDVLEDTPAVSNVSSDMVVREMDEMVVVVNEYGEILELNPEAQDTLGREESDVIEETLAAVFGYTLEEMRDSTLIEYRSPEGTRQYRPSVSPLADEDEKRLGYAVVLSDVTQEKRREQRLEVMNRVLRHNLRNDMNGVLAYAELISDGHNRPEAMAERIHDGATDVVEIGEKAREIEELMGVPLNASESIELRTVVDRVVDRVDDDCEDWKVSVNVPETVTVSADSRVLEPVVRNLVENAVEHNDGSCPRVEITAEREDDADAAVLTIADDGPGIPAYEREVLTTETETPLEHGSGLGLWAVKWGIARLGGEVGFESSDLGGSSVTVALPLSAREAEPAFALEKGAAD